MSLYYADLGPLLSLTRLRSHLIVGSTQQRLSFAFHANLKTLACETYGSRLSLRDALPDTQQSLRRHIPADWPVMTHISLAQRLTQLHLQQDAAPCEFVLGDALARLVFVTTQNHSSRLLRPLARSNISRENWKRACPTES